MSEAIRTVRSSRPEVLCKKGVLRNFTKFTGKHLCQSLFCSLRPKKETLAQVFSCEFCEISKNTFSYRTPPVAAFELWEMAKYCGSTITQYKNGSNHI